MPFDHRSSQVIDLVECRALLRRESQRAIAQIERLAERARADLDVERAALYAFLEFESAEGENGDA